MCFFVIALLFIVALAVILFIKGHLVTKKK